MYLLCSETFSLVKEYNVKRNCISKHPSHFKSIQGQCKKQNVEKVIKYLRERQAIFVTRCEDKEIIIRASYTSSENVVKHTMLNL